MTPRSGLGEPRGFRWRRWYAPLVVAVALAADYFSPAQLWTAFLPLGFMAVLLTFRERIAALAVLFLSSWILLPAAGAVCATYDASQGKHRLLGVQFDVPGLDPHEFSQCYAGEMYVVPLLDDARPGSQRVLVVSGFAAYYNQVAVWYVHHGEACQPDSKLYDSTLY
ncbi:MAG TPA: hypothetical protein VN914_09345 [Polyangia bacterium]|nr:hypothetical protein [Polyangia bacterium]